MNIKAPPASPGSPRWQRLPAIAGVVSRFERAVCWQSYPAIRYYFTVVSWCQHNIARYEMGIDWLDPEWGRLEADVAEALAHVGPWRRRVIERHVFRQLDYFRRTGQ